jgi:hypothetical protein
MLKCFVASLILLVAFGGAAPVTVRRTASAILAYRQVFWSHFPVSGYTEAGTHARGRGELWHAENR